MKRLDIILAGLDKDMRGLEIAPWHAPLVAKRDGWNTHILDVFDTSTLQSKADADPNIRPSDHKIEQVDFVGSATDIAELVPLDLHQTFDHIVSSHNFEHLPNPIRFLQGCQRVLKPGGVLSMAVPDGRACFDYFRPHTVTADWLEAYARNRTRPADKDIFTSRTHFAALDTGVSEVTAFFVDCNVNDVKCTSPLDAAPRFWELPPSETYQDTHCSVITPASLNLILVDLTHLGLLNMSVQHISRTNGCEFFVRIKNEEPARLSAPDLQAERNRLMRRIWRERSGVGPIFADAAALPVRVAKRAIGKLRLLAGMARRRLQYNSTS